MKNDTHKKFREWIDTNYQGCPDEQQWQDIVIEDRKFDYVSQCPSAVRQYEISESFNVEEQLLDTSSEQVIFDNVNYYEVEDAANPF